MAQESYIGKPSASSIAGCITCSRAWSPSFRARGPSRPAPRASSRRAGRLPAARPSAWNSSGVAAAAPDALAVDDDHLVAFSRRRSSSALRRRSRNARSRPPTPRIRSRRPRRSRSRPREDAHAGLDRVMAARRHDAVRAEDLRPHRLPGRREARWRLRACAHHRGGEEQGGGSARLVTSAYLL